MVRNSREGGATLPLLVLDMHRRTGYGRTHQGCKEGSGAEKAGGHTELLLMPGA
jgi:hypothetical protein